jgi:hypothetical protein
MKMENSKAHNLLKSLVGAPGFEPGASCAQGRRATRLRYAPTRIAMFILKQFPTVLLIANTAFGQAFRELIDNYDRHPLRLVLAVSLCSPDSKSFSGKVHQHHIRAPLLPFEYHFIPIGGDIEVANVEVLRKIK